MKKYVIASLMLLLAAFRLEAQYVGFEPNDGHVYLCPGTSSNVTVNIYWSCTSTPYPPKVSDAAYVRLTAEGQTYESNWHNTNIGNNIPQSLSVSSGTHTWTIELYEHFTGEQSFVKTSEATHTFFVKYTIYAANNFGSGNISLEDSTVTSGASTTKYIGESVSVGAIDQYGGIYYRLWNTSGTNNSCWKLNSNPINGATSRNYSYTVTGTDNGITLTADLKIRYNATFSNSGRSITANGTTGTSSVAIQVVDQNAAIVSTVSSYTDGGVVMTFNSWQKNGVSYTSPITVTSAGTYTAKYTGKPGNNVLGTNLSSIVDQPVVVYWTDYGNANVTQYKVYRKIKQSDGSYGTPVLLATLGSGVETYTDSEYDVSATNIKFLAYQVKAYYSPDQTYSDDYWVTTFGKVAQTQINNNINGDSKIIQSEQEKPLGYSISNYPNPFNPTTTINYQLPTDGMVTLKVYDVIGKEVATLVNDHRAAGTYNVEFNASGLPSGIYVYRLSSNNFTESKKMLLMK